jgi:hypothetical protein
MIISWFTSFNWLALTRWSPVETALLTVAGLLFLRHFAVILAAEQGRKRDLLRHSARLNSHISTTAQMMLSVVIPCETTADMTGLQMTLAHLTAQQYPANLLRVFVVSAQRVSDAIAPVMVQADPARQMKSLIYPLSDHPGKSDLIHWGMERVLAQVGHGGLVILHPGDAVKSDFAGIVAARLLEHPVIQGNILDRAAPRTLLGGTQSIANRIRNRVVNAGRWHLGLHPWLMDTGWAIRQELLEMVPFRPTVHVRNVEYALRLALQDMRVLWAPNVQVFREQPGLSMRYLAQHIVSVFEQGFLVLRYLPLALYRAVTKLDGKPVDMVCHLLKPPALVLGVALAWAAWSSYAIGYPLSLIKIGSAKVYVAMVLMVMVTQIVQLLVARGKLSDLLTMVFLTIPAYLWTLLFMPFSLGTVISRLGQRRQPNTARYRQVARTRFQDELFVPLEPILESAIPYPGSTYSGRSHASDNMAQALPVTERPAAVHTAAAEEPPELTEATMTYWLSNGQKKLPCVVTFQQQQGQYQLILEYKNTSSATGWHATLDNAQTELDKTLAKHGLSLLEPSMV